METVSVTTANTVCIRQRNKYIRIINHSGNGIGMPDLLKNEIKIRFMGKIRPENQ